MSTRINFFVNQNFSNPPIPKVPLASHSLLDISTLLSYMKEEPLRTAAG